MAAAHAERIGKRMRKRRKELGLSQGAVARALPGTVDGNQVSRWERGEHRPQDDTLERIATILKVDVSYFMTSKPKPGTPDLMGTLNGNRSQLDRIETLLRDIATALNVPVASLDPAEEMAQELEDDGQPSEPPDDEDDEDAPPQTGGGPAS